MKAKSFNGIVALKTFFATVAFRTVSICRAAFCGMAIVALLPIIASADQFGTVAITLNEESQNWYTISSNSGGALSASATFTNDTTLSNLSIQAHPEPVYSANNVLSIALTYYGAYETGKAPITVEVVYLTDGIQNPFYTSDGVASTPTASVEFLEDGKNPGHVTGHFAAKICLLKELSGEPDLNDCKDIKGRFDTGLQIQ